MTPALDIARLAELLQAVDCQRCPYRSPAHGDCSGLAALAGQAPCDAARQELDLARIDGEVS